jgi:hypothetical protein
MCAIMSCLLISALIAALVYTFTRPKSKFDVVILF